MVPLAGAVLWLAGVDVTGAVHAAGADAAGADAAGAAGADAEPPWAGRTDTTWDTTLATGWVTTEMGPAGQAPVVPA